MLHKAKTGRKCGRGRLNVRGRGHPKRKSCRLTGHVVTPIRPQPANLAHVAQFDEFRGPLYYDCLSSK